MVLLLIAGIAAFTIGIIALVYGIPIKEFSFGNTMIITGAIFASTGLLLLGFWVVVREMRAFVQRLQAGELPALPRAAPAPAPTPARQAEPEPEPIVIGDLTAPPHSEEAAPPPWTEPEPAPAPEPPPPPKKRNLLFSSTSRKERERAAAKAAEQPSAATEAEKPELIPAAPMPEPVQPQAEPADARTSFEAAWPQAERARPGTPLTAPTPPIPPAPQRVRPDPKPVASEVTILKSGVVDGMAYSLYSDGSIEAQMPEGMVRFASIDELRAHLDQRT